MKIWVCFGDFKYQYPFSKESLTVKIYLIIIQTTDIQSKGIYVRSEVYTLTLYTADSSFGVAPCPNTSQAI